MIIDLVELLAQLRARTLLEHRHSNVELKQSWSQDVGKKISSNANKIHIPVAWVVIGVTDAGVPLGKDDGWAKRVEEEISGHLNQYLDPAQTCQSLETHELGPGRVVVIKLANPGAVVYWNKKAYKSAGTTIDEMEPEECMQLTVSLPGLHDYSAQKWSGQIDADAVRRFAGRVAKGGQGTPLASIAEAEPEAALHRLGIKDRNVAKLLFGPASFRLIFVDAAGVPTRNETIRPLYRLFDPQLYSEIERWTRDFHYTNQSVYPIRAFHEGIANMVAHAAYFERDGEIMVEVFPDRLCLSNLCTRESAYFANRWFSRSHKTVNNLLMESLRMAGHVDELGRGKSVIFGEYINFGRPAPSVAIERAGRVSRWRLILPGGLTNERHVRLLERLRAHHKDPQKALIALALVLWRDKPVEEIRTYIDGECAPLFAEVLENLDGATFYWAERDQIVLRRWARVLLDEGVDSKALSEGEEEHLYRTAYNLQTKFHDGLITPKGVRDLGQLGATGGAKSISSKLLSKWVAQGRAVKVKTGLYRFTSVQPEKQLFPDVLQRFTSPSPAKIDGIRVLPTTESEPVLVK